jgi:peptidoglycan/LPS O-acetylase OafA/YrhL
LNTEEPHPPSARPGYRPDIDGLRAVAVIAVVWFHAFPHQLAGGFIGVDVFFVISGYLIAGLLLKEQEAGRFRLLRFYASRARRIFPALVLVLATTVAMGWWLLLPDEFVLLGKHVAASAAFVENFMLWHEAGYFDMSNESKPVMHLWSLAVEEQFYLLFPCALWLAARKGISAVRLVGTALLLSLCWNVARITADPVGTFLSPLSRMWELMAGALLACREARGLLPRLRPAGTNALSLVGLAMLLAPMWLLNDLDLYPGWNAIAPVVGTVLVVAAGPQAVVNRWILAARPLIWIGLVSYPLYLWHWPVLTYARVAGVGARADWLVGAIVVSCVLAWLTYALVERPVRFGRFRHQAPLPLAVALSLVAAIGLAMHLGQGVRRFQPLVPAEELAFDTHWRDWARCDLVRATGSETLCAILDPAAPPSIALIGDSHAGHLATGLRTILDGSPNAVVLTRGSCFPVLTVGPIEEKYFGCKEGVIAQAMAVAARTPSIHTVLLSGYAPLAISGTRLHQPPSTDPQLPVRARAFEQALERTLENLLRADKRVVYLLPVPEMSANPRDCARTMLWGGIDEACRVLRERVAQRTQSIRDIAARMKLRFPDVTFIDPTDALCDGVHCFAGRDGTLYYLDRDHLSPSGSRLVMRALESQLLPLLAPDARARARQTGS